MSQQPQTKRPEKRSKKTIFLSPDDAESFTQGPPLTLVMHPPQKFASPKESTDALGFEARLCRIWLAKHSKFCVRNKLLLALRGIEDDFGKENAYTFRAVQHHDLRADYVLANPPLNDSDWHRKDDVSCAVALN